jgi:uncharacterized alkaline shock family protein YloU
MRGDQIVDLGSVQIHKKVIGDIAAESIKDIPGVTLATFGLFGILAETFGYKNYPGVSVRIAKDQQVTIEIRVIINYGSSIPDVARHIQDVIQQAVETAIDIYVREINVSIQAIERRVI